MTKTMYDAVNPRNIPRNASVVAGYINGRYKWSSAEWALFPRAERVRIQVYIPGHPVLDDGDVLDVEANDAATERGQKAAALWCAMRLKGGHRPCIYTSKSTQRYVMFPGVDYWLAHYTNMPHLIPGTVATQYMDYRGLYDISVVVDDWPKRIDLPPPPPPSHVWQGEKYMFIPAIVPDTDWKGDGYIDIPNCNAALVVNAVNNCSDPQAGEDGYKLPVFNGALQVGTAARIVFTGGKPHTGPFDTRIVVDKQL